MSGRAGLATRHMVTQRGPAGKVAASFNSSSSGIRRVPRFLSGRAKCRRSDRHGTEHPHERADVLLQNLLVDVLGRIAGAALAGIEWATRRTTEQLGLGVRLRGACTPASTSNKCSTTTPARRRCEDHPVALLRLTVLLVVSGFIERGRGSVSAARRHRAEAQAPRSPRRERPGPSGQGGAQSGRRVTPRPRSTMTVIASMLSISKSSRGRIPDLRR